tara:strand:- start:35 stop:532 length:498 start_codon:yes stop_codon:yes gene_type:complete
MSQPVPIAGYEGRYEIHPDGRVWSTYRKGKFLGTTVSKKGYTRVCLTKSQVQSRRSVHRLLAEAYIPNPDNKPLVDHIDQDKSNNTLDNLRWVTHAENSQNAKLKKLNTTGVQGVNYRESRHPSPWGAYINIDGKQKCKSFATKEEAVAWRKAMKLEHYIQAPAI